VYASDRDVIFALNRFLVVDRSHFRSDGIGGTAIASTPRRKGSSGKDILQVAVPVANNLDAIQRALETAGLKFISEMAEARAFVLEKRSDSYRAPMKFDSYTALSRLCSNRQHQQVRKGFQPNIR
jgi:hypothetical protein